METMDAITSRRDVREFSDDELTHEQLATILEAGRRAPSSMNWQPWDFVVVTDRDQLRQLAGVWKGAVQVADSAATIALITAHEPETQSRKRAEYDLGQATLQMMLTATDMGVGSGHTAVEDQELAREVLGLPEDRDCAYLVPLGVPADRAMRPITEPDRRPFDDVVHWDRW